MAIIMKVMGGLASQLHKYAVGRALALKYKQDLKLDLSWFDNTPPADTPWKLVLDKFNADYTIAGPEEIATLRGGRWRNALANRLQARLGINISKPTRYSGERLARLARSAPAEKLPAGGAYLEGEIIGVSPFAGIEALLRQELTLREEHITAEVQRLAARMRAESSVALHVRRGDFLSNSHAAKFHMTCGVEYFLRAVKYLEGKIPQKLKIYIFSDDLPWVKNNLEGLLEGAQVIEGFDEAQTFYLISQCRHFVISNSGFSWLASWLGRTEQSVVVAPRVWLQDARQNRRHVEHIMFDNVVLIDNG